MKTIIAVVCKDGIEWEAWLKQSFCRHYGPYCYSYNKERRILTFMNVEFRCITRADHCRGIHFDAVIEAWGSYMNKEYKQIIEIIKQRLIPCQKSNA